MRPSAPREVALATFPGSAVPDLPLYFDFTVQITGPAFRADVRIRGRATCVAEFGETWIYGVNPGSLAASGRDIHGAFAAFKEGIAESLCDLAEESGAFRVFRSAVRRFAASTNRASVREWEQAREAIRGGAAADVSLARETGDLALRVEVSPLAATGDGEPMPSRWQPSGSDGSAVELLAA